MNDEKTVEIELPKIKLTQTIPARVSNESQPVPPAAPLNPPADSLDTVRSERVPVEESPLSPWILRMVAVVAILVLSLFVV